MPCSAYVAELHLHLRTQVKSLRIRHITMFLKKDLWVFVCVYICLKDWKRALDSPEAGVLRDFKSFTVDAGASPLVL